jgi:mannitol/fructose-specific phosphotransferase system IIA component (Ntr-type)
MIAVPQNSNQEYMRILRNLSEYLRKEENRATLLGASSDLELYNYVHEIEDIIIASLAH